MSPQNNPGARTGLFAKLALLIALAGAIGVAIAMALPLRTTVTFVNEAAIPEPITVERDVDCGSPIRNGPAKVSTAMTWVDEPCAGPIRQRRLTAAAGGAIAVVAGVGALALERRRRA